MNDVELIMETELTRNDVELIEALCEERARLRREMLQLSNESIAEKFDTTAKEINKIAKYMNHQRCRPPKNVIQKQKV